MVGRLAARVVGRPRGRPALLVATVVAIAAAVAAAPGTGVALDVAGPPPGGAPPRAGAGLAASVRAGVPFPEVLDASCGAGPPRVRKEIGSLTEAEMGAYQSAVLALHAKESTTGGLDWFEQFVAVHAAFADSMHWSGHFLAWHRLFLLAFENALRAIDPAVTIPYWDWSMDATDPASSPVWGATRLGGAVDGGCIQGGPFGGMEVDNAGGWSDGTHCVTRGFASGQVEGIPTDFETKAVMEGVWSDTSMDFAGFAAALESIHGIPHVEVGGIYGQGDMTWLELATADVAFWSHHAYIDYVWSRRQGAPGIDAGAYGGPFGAVEASPADVLAPFNLPAAAAIGLSCVSYVPDTRMSRAEPTAAPSTSTPAPTPTASASATATATATATASPTATASATPDPTANATPSPTASATPSPTPSPTASATPSPTASATPSPTASATPSPTASATPSPTPSPTASATPSPTPSPTASATPSPAPSPTASATPSPTASATPDPTASATATATPPVPAVTPRHGGVKATPTATACARHSDCGCGLCDSKTRQCVVRPSRTAGMCGVGATCGRPAGAPAGSKLTCSGGRACATHRDCGCGQCSRRHRVCVARAARTRSVCGAGGVCALPGGGAAAGPPECSGGVPCTAHRDCGCGRCSQAYGVCVVRARRTARACGEGATCGRDGAALVCVRPAVAAAAVAAAGPSVRAEAAAAAPQGAGRHHTEAERAAVAALVAELDRVTAAAATAVEAAEAEAAAADVAVATSERALADAVPAWVAPVPVTADGALPAAVRGEDEGAAARKAARVARRAARRAARRKLRHLKLQAHRQRRNVKLLLFARMNRMDGESVLAGTAAVDAVEETVVSAEDAAEEAADAQADAAEAATA